MLKGFIISRYTDMSESYVCQRLIEEASLQNVSLKTIGVFDSYVLNGRLGSFSEDEALYDFGINRYKWNRTKDAFGPYACRFYNETEAFNRYINKYEQVKNLKSDSFVMPKYILSTANISFEILKSELSLPFVAKGLESSEGKEIHLIENVDDYAKLVKLYGPYKEFLFQEFIAGSFGKDIRLFSIRGEVLACLTRSSQSDFRSNFALGGSIEALALNEDYRNIARDIYIQTGLDFLGIDLLYGETKPYFCEINVMPGFKGAEKASGVNIAKKIIETIRGDFHE